MRKKGVNFSKHSKEYFDSIEDPNKKLWSDISVALIIALAFFLLIFVVPKFFYEVVEIDGASMEPTVYEEINKVGILKTKNVSHGDIVVIDSEYLGLKDENGKVIKYIIKRVIGLEGDIIEIRDNGVECRIYRNGVDLDEPYINGKMNHTYAGREYVVGENCIFVMGDNRNNSNDSRNDSPAGIGQLPMPVEKIVGKAITILTKTSDFLGVDWYSTKFL